DLPSCVLNGIEAAADLTHVIDGHSSWLFGFVFEKIDERGLSTFNLRGDDGFFADKRINKPVERWHHLAGDFKTRKRLLGAREQRRKLAVHLLVSQGSKPRASGGGWDKRGWQALQVVDY